MSEQLIQQGTEFWHPLLYYLISPFESLYRILMYFSNKIRCEPVRVREKKMPFERQSLVGF